jgi:hypothetical protein
VVANSIHFDTDIYEHVPQEQEQQDVTNLEMTFQPSKFSTQKDSLPPSSDITRNPRPVPDVENSDQGIESSPAPSRADTEEEPRRKKKKISWDEGESGLNTNGRYFSDNEEHIR